jgi:predicted lactoylglutathione lyase
MAKQIFVNLPVRDLQRSIDFFTNVGFNFDPQFTDATATCMILGDNFFAMLLTEEKFRTFTPKPICDATKFTEVLVALAVDDRGQVDEFVRRAVAAGGSTYNEPQDHGFMYSHGFQDPDGHVWEVFFMDLAALPPQ